MKLLLLLSVLVSLVICKKDPKDCEVCVKVIKGMQEALWTKFSKTPSEANVEKVMKKYCKTHKFGTPEGRQCEELMEIKRTASTSLKTKGFDAKYLCKKMSKHNKAICDQRFPQEYSVDTDWKTLRVKQLKRIIANKGLKCRGCSSKDDFIRVIRSYYEKKDL